MTDIEGHLAESTGERPADPQPAEATDEALTPETPAEAPSAEPPALLATIDAPAGDAQEADPATAAPSQAHGAWALVAVAGVAVAALLGGNIFGLRDRLTGSTVPKAEPPAVSRQADQGTTASTAQPTVLRSYPWWQTIDSFDGTGTPAVAPTFAVASNMLQWRVRWSCQSGVLMVTANTASHPLVDAPCPGSGTGFGDRPGPTTLAVTASGTWHLEADQQVDVPLVEPPTSAMTTPGTQTIRTGTFYNVDQSGSGQLTFYRQADGTESLRLDSFFITPNVDLEIRLSPLPAPHSTKEYQSAASVLVAPLDITTGSINFTVPATVDPTQYGSVVIWCPLIQSAYAAATLH